MTHTSTRIVTALAVALLTSSAWAVSWSETANYYVDGVSGSDTNAGTSSAPYKTIGKAATVANAGKKVLVWGGQTYNERVVFGTNGTSGSRITFKVDPSSGLATVDAGGATNAAFYSTKAYITVDGFLLTDSNYGIYLFGDTTDGWIIQNCVITGNSDNGIYLRSGDDGTVSNCLVYGNGSTNIGIYVYSSALNTTIDHCTVDGQKYGIQASSSSVATITSSIVTNSTTTRVRNQSSTVTITYSDVWGTAGSNYSGVTAGTGCISDDPDYTDSGSGDYSLQGSSPCLGAGAGGSDMGYSGPGGGGGGGNNAPTVDAGSNQNITLPTDSVNLDGTVSDDGEPDPPGSVTTTWTKQSGPGTVTFNNASNVDTTATFSTDGTYVLRLTADDDDLTAFDECTITVNPEEEEIATYTVTNTSNSGAGSFSSALSSAASDGEPSKIVFSVSGTITPSGSFSISQNDLIVTGEGEDIVFDFNSGSAGFLVSGDNNWFANITVIDTNTNTDGFTLTGENNVVERCTFDLCRDEAVGVTGSGARGNVIAYCRIENCGSQSSPWTDGRGILVTSGASATIVGNYIDHCARGITVNGNFADIRNTKVVGSLSTASGHGITITGSGVSANVMNCVSNSNALQGYRYKTACTVYKTGNTGSGNGLGLESTDGDVTIAGSVITVGDTPYPSWLSGASTPSSAGDVGSGTGSGHHD